MAMSWEYGLLLFLLGGVGTVIIMGGLLWAFRMENRSDSDSKKKDIQPDLDEDNALKRFWEDMKNK
tara:strand:- start:47 stop:244 length:198 start_codon:yes stop_codon:yes gene_type:complete